MLSEIEETLFCAFCRAPGVAVCDHTIGWLRGVDGRKDIVNPEAFTCSLVVCASCLVRDKCIYHAGRPDGTALLTEGVAASLQGNLRLLATDGGLTKPYIQWATAAPATTPSGNLLLFERQLTK